MKQSKMRQLQLTATKPNYTTSSLQLLL